LKEYFGSHSEVVFVYLFGSAGESERFEDVDIGVYVANIDRLGDAFDYAFGMSRELEQLLECPVDVIVMNTAPAHLIYSISKGRLVVNREDDVRVEFITASWKRYFDIQPRRLQAINDILS